MNFSLLFEPLSPKSYNALTQLLGVMLEFQPIDALMYRGSAVGIFSAVCWPHLLM